MLLAAGAVTNIQAVPAPAPAPVPWNATVVAAFIGAASALTVVVFKDLLLELWKERRTRRHSEAEVYEQYLAPLCEACEKIVWRTREIFVLDRHAFLKTHTLPLQFNAYKRASTLYRIAVVIGLIRGMRLELSSLPRRNPSFSSPITKAIGEFQGALADGPSVETERLKRLCAIWQFDLSSQSREELDRLAMRFEVKAHEAAGTGAGSDLRSIAALSVAKKQKLCRELASFLAADLGVGAPAVALVTASIDAAVEGLVFREALLYRDWQDALGDEMIESDKDSARRFRIVGYARFAELLEQKQSPWMIVFAASIDDIDLEILDSNDFRGRQLKRLARAAASILVQASASMRHPPVDAGALEAAKVLLTKVPAEPA
jgi:hypothetical protein